MLQQSWNLSFSVTQLEESSNTWFYLYDYEGEIDNVEVRCNNSFSEAISLTTASTDTIIGGQIGSKATLKVLNDGMI